MYRFRLLIRQTSDDIEGVMAKLMRERGLTLRIVGRTGRGDGERLPRNAFEVGCLPFSLLRAPSLYNYYRSFASVVGFVRLLLIVFLLILFVVVD
jgi:hypothetical protein